MPDFQSIEPAVDPNNRASFLLDWELTMKCNLDCSYCEKGIYGGHDNTTQHPPLDQCVATIEFMFKYVDIYMQRKPKANRYVILNVYGGESLHHPYIVPILKRVHQAYQESYKHKWHLSVTTTTNAIVTRKKLANIMPFIDEFTVSYHSENTLRQKQVFKSNIKDIVANGTRLKCVILMHADKHLFQDAQAMIDWCQENQIKFLPRQLDHAVNKTHLNYWPKQIVWFDRLYKSKSYNNNKQTSMQPASEKTDLSSIGRACCGGRSLCKNQSYKSREFFVENKFPDWYCSVNEFFLYIKQVTGEIFTNKDCQMNFDHKIGPIGNLNNAEVLLDAVRALHKNSSLPVIQCKKTRCYCGLCAPKAEHLQDYNKIMEKYRL